ncbi:permease [Robertkochia solimangrovi]|uniref:permease n=1 Tax=Robertkochia solimangrovi TaxID=2213046 RepID=UPI00117D2E40|nr:permease [Robertkochia solimangrovi]TRZ45867.1 permease [Robertkochia solimangrovi]
MNVVLSKTLVFISFMVIGVILKSKFSSKEETDGLKKIILNLALPATIFIALLEVKIDLTFLMLPLLALALNVIFFLVTPRFLDLIGIDKSSPVGRTSRMLLPSLAPGLSCFPFVLEFLGHDFLAKAAMADLGNKIFVLLILYLVALSWFRKNCEGFLKEESRKDKLWALVKKMLAEPVNLLMFAAIAFIMLGIHLNDFPVFLKDIIERLSYIMTPLVLLYIGLAVKLKKHQMGTIFSLLSFRAGLAMILGGLLVWLGNIEVDGDILLILAFSLSACSFWPFMHIAMVDAEENKLGMEKKTFDTNFAIAILAFSLPISVVFILFVLSSDKLFTNPVTIFITGFVLLLLAVLPVLLRRIKASSTYYMNMSKMLNIKELAEEKE